MENRHASKGFTLLELLIAIGLIAMLAAAALAAFDQAREQSQIVSAQQEIIQMAKAIEAARIGSSQDYLRIITGSQCTRCPTPTESNLTRALQRISSAAGTFQRLEQSAYDPWGELYLLDENEGEQVGNPCIRDTIATSNNLVRYRLEYGSNYCKENPQGTPGFY